jgi:hypothetical protein
MGFLQILQLVGLIPSIIKQVEDAKASKPGKVKREEVKAIALTMTSVTDALTKMNVRDQKKFDKGLDKVVDGIVDMLNASDWA